jgi:hypothetical protein
MTSLAGRHLRKGFLHERREKNAPFDCAAQRQIKPMQFLWFFRAFRGARQVFFVDKNAFLL